MGNRKLTATTLGALTLGVLVAFGGMASAKNLLPSSAVPATTAPASAQPTVPAPRAQRTVAQTAYVPGFDYGPRKPVHNRSISAAASTIPGAPSY